jgi:hypothetical protein
VYLDVAGTGLDRLDFLELGHQMVVEVVRPPALEARAPAETAGTRRRFGSPRSPDAAWAGIPTKHSLTAARTIASVMSETLVHRVDSGTSAPPAVVMIRKI